MPASFGSKPKRRCLSYDASYGKAVVCRERESERVWYVSGSSEAGAVGMKLHAHPPVSRGGWLAEWATSTVWRRRLRSHAHGVPGQ